MLGANEKNSVKAVFLRNILLGDFVGGLACAWLQLLFFAMRGESLGTLLQLRLCTLAVEAFRCAPLTARSFLYVLCCTDGVDML